MILHKVFQSQILAWQIITGLKLAQKFKSQISYLEEERTKHNSSKYNLITDVQTDLPTQETVT